MSFAKLIREARGRDDYWIEDAILTFTMQLAAMMEKRGISKTELARRVGVSQPYITRILKGGDNLTVATMVKLARAVGAHFQVSLQEPSEVADPPLVISVSEDSRPVAGPEPRRVPVARRR